LSNTPVASETRKRLSIYEDGKSWRGNISMNQINEMLVQPFTRKGRDNETPFKPIESFCKVYFKHERLVLPGAQSKRVSNFLGNNNIVANTSTLYESLLRRMDKVWQVWLESFC
jgi:hypothetical protein